MTTVKNVWNGARTNKLGGLILLCAAALFTCEKVPEYCVKEAEYDPACQFCYGDKAYDLCGGEKYNPLTEGCTKDSVVGTRCLAGPAVPFGDLCGGDTLALILTTASIPEEGGTVARNPESTAYNSGDSVTVTATANPGYKFDGWVGADMSKKDTIKLTMNDNKTLAAVFVKINDTEDGDSAWLTTSAFPDNGGRVARAPDSTAYKPGDSVTVTANKNPGYTFAGWSGASASKNESVPLIMDSSKTLVALFKPVPCKITVGVKPDSGGAVFVDGTALVKSMDVDFGTKIEVRAVPETRYVFKGWSELTGAGSTSQVLNITVDGDTTLTANFILGNAEKTPPPPPPAPATP